MKTKPITIEKIVRERDQRAAEQAMLQNNTELFAKRRAARHNLEENALLIQRTKEVWQ
ncbi:MAG: hypothetical protein NT086_19705 [Proteobacteria bacterium]|nr:hypothetical protein [Pseudomonadota bacterium]